MVTMKKPGETSIQSFSLPLTSLVTDEQTERDHEAVEKVCLNASNMSVYTYHLSAVKLTVKVVLYLIVESRGQN